MARMEATWKERRHFSLKLSLFLPTLIRSLLLSRTAGNDKDVGVAKGWSHVTRQNERESETV
jgi:hypothetical protein